MTDPVVGVRPEPYSVPVVLHAPDPVWPDLFAADAVAIRSVLLQIREPGWLEHRVLYQRVERGCAHDINVHVLSPERGAAEIERMLGLRDWLRSHPADRDRYAAVKGELARRRWRQVQDYADDKTEVVKEILAKVAQARR
jgi:GrpB-like predicted nucleotidyltransferase (UPF0157 family)